MKSLVITALLCGIVGSLYAQQIKNDTIIRDTVVHVRKHHVKVSVGAGSDTTDVAANINRLTKRIEAKKSKSSGFSFGLSFDNLHLGFATLLDNGSFTLSPQNNFLDYRQIKTSNVGFDVLKLGYRFNDNFKLSISGGFDWTLIRLKQNINIVPDAPTLTFVNSPINYSKNRFSSNYLVIPLSFDLRTKEYRDGKRFHFVFGPETGFLIDGMQKQISDDLGKKKNFNDFHFTRFEYGAFTRIAYGNLGIYAKYYFNDMFENSPAQKGLKSFDFGLTLGF